MAAAHPDETPADWEYRIAATALRPSPSVRTTTLGWGIIAPYAALNFINDGTMAGPVNPRFDPVASAAPAFMARPPEEIDTAGPERRRMVTLLGVGSAMTVIGLLLIARLRRDRP